APRDRAQSLANVAASEATAYQQLAQQAQQQATSLQDQANKLQTRLRDWPVLKQGIEYEIAADALHLQAEQDLLDLYTPVQRQKLETLDKELDLAQKALQRLNSEKIPAQQQATDLTENRLKETQAEVEAIEILRAAAHQSFQNALEMSGFLLPYRERLSAVQQGIQELLAAKLQVLETMQGLTKELLQTPSEIIQTQLKYWADYLENLEQELDWANLQKDQLAMAIADSPERLAISRLIKELETAPNSINPKSKIQNLKSYESGDANFLQGFDNLDKRLADAKAEKTQTGKELDKLEQEYRQLGLQKANLEDNLIPAKVDKIKGKEQEIEETEDAIAQTKSNLSTISAAQTDIPSAIASTDATIQQQKSAVQGYQNQIGQAFAAANSWEAERQRQQAAANYWNGQIYTRNGSGLFGFLSGLLYNTQAQANRNAAQAAANNAAYQRDLASSNAQQLNASLQPQIATSQQQIDILETDKNLLVKLSQLNTQLTQQQQQRDTLLNELADLNQQKTDTEQKISNKYREIELTDEYLQQVEGEADRLQSRSDLLKQAGILEQKYLQNWQAWQQATQEQATATQNLLATRESGEPLRQQLTGLQQQLQGVEEQLKDGRSLQQSIDELQQSLAFSNLQLGNQNLLLQSLIDRDPSLAAAEQAFLNQAAAHQQKIWYWNGSGYAYNPAEAEAYRANLQQASFIADLRNKTWQQRQQTTAKINELNQKIAQQQSDIAQKQSELSAIGPTVQQLEAQATAVKGAIASINQQLQPLQTEENRLAKVIQTAAAQAQNLAAELSQTTQLQSTALRQLISFGILASESDVDFFGTQVEPQVKQHLAKLGTVGNELGTQINNLKQQIANLEEKLANTADDVSKQALNNLISQSQAQLSNLSSLETSNKTSADELETLFKQATEGLTPLRQKQELEIRQKLESNDKRLESLQSQLNSEQAADAAIESGKVLDYAQLADRINNDLRLNVTNGTQQLLASYPQTKELGQQQQDLSKSVDDLIGYINDNYADPHGEYHRTEANLGDAIATLGVLENRADALDSSVSLTEDAIERIKLRIQQDAELWEEIAPIAIRYGVESEQLKQYQSELEAIKTAKSPKLGQAEALLTTAKSLQQQAEAESNRYSMLTQQITALKNILPPQIRTLLEQLTQSDRVETIHLFGKTLTFNLSNSLTAILRTYPYANYAGIIDQINSLQQQAQVAQNQSSALTQQASDLHKQADVLKQQANDDVNAEVKALRSTFLKENPENGTAIDLLKGATLEGRNSDREILNLLNATQADLPLNADAVEGRNPNQALLDKAKAAQASLEAQGNAALAQAAWYEQQAAYHWSVSRKNGPSWDEKRWVKGRCGKGHWETITHIDHNWILWSQYSQIFPQLRQQGTANLIEADKWRKVVERIEPLAKQWTEANNAANEAEPAVKEARNLFAQLEA
ncbi:MAG: hypothetical protein HC786_33035, partial [Richelia sp. CSU_2_1]|nr:hypothetical protein [Richelia sp. CSU_2_1]